MLAIAGPSSARNVVPGLLGGPVGGRDRRRGGGAGDLGHRRQPGCSCSPAPRCCCGAADPRAGGAWPCWSATSAPTSRCCSPVARASVRSSASTRATPPTRSTPPSSASPCACGTPAAWPATGHAAGAGLLVGRAGCWRRTASPAAFGTALLVPHFQNTRGPRLRHQPPRRPRRRPDPGHLRRPGPRGAGAAAGRRRQPVLRDLRAAAGAARPSTSRRPGCGSWDRTGTCDRWSWPARCRASPAPTTTAATRSRAVPVDVELAAAGRRAAAAQPRLLLGATSRRSG